MKKILVATALGLSALLTVQSVFAGGNSIENIKTIDKGSLIVYGNTTIAFNKNNEWVYTIKHFSADNLPKNIFDIVRENYGGYYISGMEQIVKPGLRPVFIVHMQDNTSIKTVQVRGHETIVTEEYTKE